jgi:aldehyde dehydrogenase (NAD+)
MATSRVYVEASIKDRFLEAYKGAFGAIAGKPGPATEHDTTHGPQVDVVQYEQVKRFLAAGEKEAKTVMGGKAIEGKVRRPSKAHGTQLM